MTSLPRTARRPVALIASASLVAGVGVLATVTAGTEQNDEALRLAVKRLDMAAAKGVIHKNQASRRKSRLMKKVNAAG